MSAPLPTRLHDDDLVGGDSYNNNSWGPSKNFSRVVRRDRLRQLRRTTLQDEGEGYLIAYDATSLGSTAELHLVDFKGGNVTVVETHRFNPSERNGPTIQMLWFRTPTLDRDPLYVLAHLGV